ncbi:hypothetical protein WDZ92_07040 [Nostoc sp. NIES-2111]
MKSTTLFSLLWAMVLFRAESGFAQADIAKIGGKINANSKPVYLKANELPMSLASHVRAHGNRFESPGKERLVVSGSLKRGGNTSSLQIITDLPGKVRIVESGGRGKTLVFDLEKVESSGAIDEIDEDLVEALAIDSVEQFFLQFRSGGVWRPLGQRYQVKGDSGFGEEVDIYEVVLVSTGRRTKEVRTKLYMFDYRTGLLRRTADTVMRAGRPVRSETIYSEYSRIDGNAVPGKVQRIVDGVESFAFTRQSGALSAISAEPTK